MKKIIYFLFTACSISLVTEGTSPDNRTISKTLPAGEFKEILSKKQEMFVDVRSPEESYKSPDTSPGKSLPG